jgi:hypothetical protein
VDYFNDRSGATNATFSCRHVPEGGWAPQADSRLFALAGYWRPSPEYVEFFPCASGMCLREEAVGNDTQTGSGNDTQLGCGTRAGHKPFQRICSGRPAHPRALRGRQDDILHARANDVLCVFVRRYKCRTGHTGHLCAVCEPSYAYQGIYCAQCAPGQRFSEWSPAKRGGIIFIFLFLLLVAIFMLFFTPLFPRVEALLALAVQPVAERMEAALGTMTRARSPTHSRPTSAGRPGSRHALPAESAPPALRTSRVSGYVPGVLNQARRRSMSLCALDARTAHDGGGTHDEAHMAVALERPSRVHVFFDTSACPLVCSPACCVVHAPLTPVAVQSASRFASSVRTHSSRCLPWRSSCKCGGSVLTPASPLPLVRSEFLAGCLFFQQQPVCAMAFRLLCFGEFSECRQFAVSEGEKM